MRNPARSNSDIVPYYNNHQQYSRYFNKWRRSYTSISTIFATFTGPWPIGLFINFRRTDYLFAFSANFLFSIWLGRSCYLLLFVWLVGCVCSNSFWLSPPFVSLWCLAPLIVKWWQVCISLLSHFLSYWISPSTPICI